MVQEPQFTGIWKSTHSYPTKDDTGEETSQYYMRVFQTGHDLVFQSEPTNDGAYMLLRLSIDGDVATGTWYEHTSPDGDFGAVMYSGAGQLIISRDRHQMEGLWAGVGINHKTKKLSVYTGGWDLEYVGEELPDGITSGH